MKQAQAVLKKLSIVNKYRLVGEISMKLDTNLKSASPRNNSIYHNVERTELAIFSKSVELAHDEMDFMVDSNVSDQLLRSVLAASSDCIKVLSLDGHLNYMSQGGRLIMEVPANLEVRGRVWTELWGPPSQSAAINALDLAKRGTNAVFQGYAATFAGNKRFWDVRVTPMLDDMGRPDRILVVSRDISYIKKIEEEREYLARELTHRLKNAFAMVQSVIGQTLRRATSVEEGRRLLSGRVRALAAAQDVLTQSNDDTISINAVIAAALAPYEDSDGRFLGSGPPITLTGRQGLGLSLALHELATNASKYGSLSTNQGHVIINWDLRVDGKFSFNWAEVNGPAVVTPLEQGFGSLLVRQIVATYFDGNATLEFPTSGAVFHLSGLINDAGAP